MNNYVDKAEFFADMLESQEKGFPTEAYALKCQLVASKMLQGRHGRPVLHVDVLLKDSERDNGIS